MAATEQQAPPTLLGFLFSYWYCARRDMDALVGPLQPQPPVFGDSGAFSAWTVGAEIELKAYAAWIKRWSHIFTYYSNLDIGGVDGSAKNQKLLEDMGLNPIPVFHGGEPWEVLEQMADEYDYLALGGMAALRLTSGPKVAGFLEKAFEICDGKAGIHGFGITTWPLIVRFPWRSIDSSSIGAGYRYGQVKTYNPFNHRWVNWKVNSKADWGKHGWLVREYGMKPSDFANPRSRECTGNLMRLAARSMRKAINDIPRTQMYVVDDGGKQAGLRRLEVYNEANAPQYYLSDTDLRPATVARFHEANEDG